jgi:hypothetical protein
VAAQRRLVVGSLVELPIEPPGVMAFVVTCRVRVVCRVIWRVVFLRATCRRVTLRCVVFVRLRVIGFVIVDSAGVPDSACIAVPAPLSMPEPIGDGGDDWA